MTYFKRNLVEQARALIELKSTKDDLMAADDMAEISSMLSKLDASTDYLQEARELDERMCKKYPQIELISSIANSMKQVPQNTIGIFLNKNPVEGVKSNLLSDMYGILADVLVKHKIVSELKEFIERVE